jgi:hypothetical protein
MRTLMVVLVAGGLAAWPGYGRRNFNVDADTEVDGPAPCFAPPPSCPDGVVYE